MAKLGSDPRATADPHVDIFYIFFFLSINYQKWVKSINYFGLELVIYLRNIPHCILLDSNYSLH